eukprot:TRINITY_DN24091_c0_g1_i1.p1 TRINITY_DN24091_c0_g1~~TRINITY_DN24091_c0_g1_i1.p1  ORF type:complete len:244 (+),score=44.55 TRINITY_DN24091_c0_g1_i1:28-732(+)
MFASSFRILSFALSAISWTRYVVIGVAGALSEQEMFEQQQLGGAATATKRDVMELLGCCFMISMRHAATDSAFASTLAQLAKRQLSREKAADVRFVRMVSVCIEELTESELDEFNAGQLLSLPKVYVDKSEGPGAKAQVLQMIDPVWDELQVGAQKMIEKDTLKKVPGKSTESTTTRAAPKATARASDFDNTVVFALLAAAVVVISLGVPMLMVLQSPDDDKNAAPKKKKGKVN